MAEQELTKCVCTGCGTELLMNRECPMCVHYDEPDYVSVCPECNGRGRGMEGWECDACDGTGRDDFN